MDLRLQDAGAKSSVFEQKKMPMSHRKGINAKAAKKEETRRQEARENGIILEKPTSSSKKTTTATSRSANNSNKRRERGIGGPSVGKFAGGTLKLSKKDISSIEGSKNKKMKKMKSSKGKSRR